MDNTKIDIAKLEYAVTCISDALHGLFDYGYDTTVILEGNQLIIFVNAIEDIDRMPKISIVPEVKDEYKLYLQVSLTFPELIQSDSDYCDTIHYYLNKWEKIGRSITEINTFVFDFAKWKYDDENGEWYY